ncbi:MAG: response regulator [Bacteroidota bacterium]
MAAYNILVIEDDPQIAESLVEMLEILGHQVLTTAESYDQAVAALDKENPDLALVDIQLKGQKTGIDVAERLRNEYKVPFIFTTAYADKETIEKAAAHSPYGYIVKPYGMKDINAGIEVAISNHQNIKLLKDEEGEVFQQSNLFVKVNSRLVRIEPDNILFVEAKGDYVLFKTPEKGYIVHSTIKNIEDKLDSSRFVRVHRSYIVNLSKIVDIEENNLLLGDLIIPVSRNQKPILLSKLNTI